MQKKIDVVNYDDIQESLELILDAECPDKKDRVLTSLDDAIGNNLELLEIGGIK